MLDAYQLRFLHSFFFFLMIRRPPRSTLFPYNDALPISYTIALEPRGNGRYHGTLARLPEGDYTVAGSARIGDRSLGTDNGKFIVLDMGTEYQDLRMNADRKSTRLNSSH